VEVEKEERKRKQWAGRDRRCGGVHVVALWNDEMEHGDSRWEGKRREDGKRHDQRLRGVVLIGGYGAAAIVVCVVSYPGIDP